MTLMTSAAAAAVAVTPERERERERESRAMRIYACIYVYIDTVQYLSLIHI